jgi:hypothetical protein
MSDPIAPVTHVWISGACRTCGGKEDLPVRIYPGPPHCIACGGSGYEKYPITIDEFRALLASAPAEKTP